MCGGMSKTALIAAYIKHCSGFESVMKNIKIISAGNGACVAEYKVDESVTNIVGTMHGGFTATLVDAISSFALHSDHMESDVVPSVSVDMHLTYMKAAQLGEEVVIDAQTVKAGKNLGFLKVDIKNKATGDLLVQGLHTKFMLRPRE